MVCFSLEKLGCYGYWSLMCTSIAMWIWLTAHWWQYVFQMVETYPMLSSSSTQSCQISTFMPFKFYISVSKHLKIAFVMMLCHFPAMDIHNMCGNTLYILCTDLFWPKHVALSCSCRPSCFCIHLHLGNCTMWPWLPVMWLWLPVMWPLSVWVHYVAWTWPVRALVQCFLLCFEHFSQ